jgi:purine-binding chemotaxis protein CheW
MNEVYLSFFLSNELFGVNVLKVLEVLQNRVVTEVPKSPYYIMGIINFRGEVVPVLDTRVRFNLPERDPNDSFVIAVLDLVKNNEPFRIGAIVDRVRDVITINSSDIKPVPPMDSKFNTGFLKGITQFDDRFMLLIDIDKVFDETILSK